MPIASSIHGRTSLKAHRKKSGTQDRAKPYGARWQRFASAFLANNPLCRYCLIRGRVKPATVVDHIMPHKGDMALFWMEDNHQALCAKCHNSTKAREENNPQRIPLYVQVNPVWCMVIAGPPASGKTTKAKHIRQERGGVVYDLDDIAQAHDLPIVRTWEQASTALHWRNYLMSKHDDTKGMIVIVSAPLVQDRTQFITRLGATVEMMDTPRQVCIDRATARGWPDPDVIEKWFATAGGG